MLNQDNTSGLKKIAWGSLSSENFWQAADKLQDDTLQKATKLFAFVSHADTATLQNILIQYRFFYHLLHRRPGVVGGKTEEWKNAKLSR